MRLLLLFLVSLCLLTPTIPAHAQKGWEKEYPFIDLDGDGTTDFALKRTQAMGNEDGVSFEVMIVPKRNNRIVKQKEGFVMDFKKGDTIGEVLPDSLRWAPYRPVLYDFVSNNSPQWRGPWPNEEAQYLGLKLMKDGKTYYGWAQVRIDRQSEFSVSVCATAYNPRPDQTIRAGYEP
jgi:hypothetical protein